MRFTVFTPAYNRAHTLRRLYESLKRQSFRDFEWLVVDVSSNKYSRVVSLIKTLFGKRTKMLCKKILKDMFHGNKREYPTGPL